MANKKYTIEISEKEMQCLANALAGFYRVTNEKGMTVGLDQTATLIGFMERLRLLESPKSNLVTMIPRNPKIEV